MSAGKEGLVSSEDKRRWSAFLVKSAVLFVILCLVGRLAPIMHPVPLAFLWAVLSAVSAMSVAYDSVIKKARNQHQYKSGSLFARLNSGRVLTLTIAFIVSAVCVGGLIMEAPKWELAEWLLVFLTIPVYLGVFELLKRFFAKQYEPLYQVSRSVKYSVIVTGVLLCVAYFVISSIGTTASYGSLSEALKATKMPFEGSPCLLLQEVGRYTAAADGVMAFGASEVAKGSTWFYLALRVVMSASAFFGVSGLIGSCMLSLKDMKLVFLPLDAIKGAPGNWTVTRRYVAVACVLPIALVAIGLVVNANASKFIQSEEYAKTQEFVKNQFDTAVFEVDGKLYDEEGLKYLEAAYHSEIGKLYSQREEELTRLINDAYDQIESNVDEYLDWYYSLPAEYERLVGGIAGSVASDAREKFAEMVESKADEAEAAILARNSEFSDQASEYLNKFKEGLEECEIGNQWKWFFKDGEKPDEANPDMTIELAEKESSVGETMRLPATIFPAETFLLLKIDEAMNREKYKEELLAPYKERRDEMLKMVEVPKEYEDAANK